MGIESIVTSAKKTFGQGGYEYGDKPKGQSRTGGGTNSNGLAEVDCSFVVGTALKQSGIVTGVAPASFTTKTLFDEKGNTELAKQRFDAVTPEQVKLL